MIADHAYFIGQTHSVCEDYAISGTLPGFAYAIVSDGCGSDLCQNVDVGARLLAWNARDRLIDDERILLIPPAYTEFGYHVAARSMIGSPSGLGKRFLDATLLIAWAQDGKGRAFIYGDGCFFHVRDHALIRYVNVDFAPNAPDYLGYRISPTELEGYKRHQIEKRIVDSALVEVQIVAPFTPVDIQAELLPGDVIGVTSDGISSFSTMDGLAIPASTMAHEFGGFKTLAGEFVQRRMNAIKKRCAANELHHYDDISMAAIHI